MLHLSPLVVLLLSLSLCLVTAHPSARGDEKAAVRFQLEKKQLLGDLTSALGGILGGDGGSSTVTAGDVANTEIPTTGLLTAPLAPTITASPTALPGRTVTLSSSDGEGVTGTDSDSIPTTGLLTAPGTLSSSSSSASANSTITSSNSTAPSSSTSTRTITNSEPSTSTTVVIVTATSDPTVQADQSNGNLQTVNTSASTSIKASLLLSGVAVGAGMISVLL